MDESRIDGMRDSMPSRLMLWVLLLTVACSEAPTSPTPTVPVVPVDPPAPIATGPPFEGTVFMSPGVIIESDPTALTGVEYTGRGERTIYDRRVDAWVTVDAYLFDARYSWGTVEFQVNPEFGNEAAARAEVDIYAPALGRLPAFLMTNARTVEVNAGVELFGGNANGSFLIHTGQGQQYIGDGFLEEVLFHEAAHVSLDAEHAAAPGWIEAQQADGEFISTYARDNPGREDVAESVLAWWVARFRPERLLAPERQAIERTIPNRLQYFDRELQG